MRVLVCGSRTFVDEEPVERVLDGIDYHESSWNNPMVVIEGGARGADALAEAWVAGFGTEYPKAHEQYPADWETHGKAAGPIRNQQMIARGKPDVVWAFINKPLEKSVGTADLVRKARKAGIPVYVVQAMQ